jgi:decaprenylphospho-beta-D-ribofuranose 2-oxidase
MFKTNISTNWSKSSRIEQTRVFEGCISQLQEYIDRSSEITLIGNGRSYSENCIARNGISTQFQRRKPILISEKPVIKTGPFTTIRELWTLIAGTKFTLPVVPGTGFVTVGGAIASDVHGKNHHRDGSFGEHIQSIKLIDGSGNLLELLPKGETADMFWATVGGMGLTGVIVEVELKLKSVMNQSVIVKEKRTQGLMETIEELSSVSSDFPYSVAWIDLSSRLNRRGIVSYAYNSDEPSKQNPFPLEGNVLSIPKIPFNLIRPISISIFNELWFRKPLNNSLINPMLYHHPLDKISNWNNLFGRKGPIQYQFVVPYSSVPYIELFLKRCYEHGFMSPLVVLKNLRKSNSAFLSFPMEGLTLTVDFSRSYKVMQFLQTELDELLAFGGRTYLAKDELVNAHQFNSMYKQLGKFNEVKNQMDPKKKFQSKLSNRLEI